MKAKYVKPDLLVESFTLMQNIASTCGVPGGGTSLGSPTHGSRTTCGWDVGGIVLWVDATHGCTEYLSENADVNGICYNAPTAGLSIFGS